jgi:hypothetical protein
MVYQRQIASWARADDLQTLRFCHTLRPGAHSFWILMSPQGMQTVTGG